jgi:predicted molibdopterin-dependent oxidoreductase YjgC
MSQERKKTSKVLTIHINDREFKASPDQTVLEVARENGIYIPTLCYHHRTGQAGKCRACVAEIAGMRGLQTTCTVKVADGMSVVTDSPRVREAQRLVVDLMLSSGRHECLSCSQCGQCELQDAAYYLGIERPTFTNDVAHDYDTSSEFIDRDHAKCIKCGRCVVGCNETVVNEVLGFGHRGAETRIICDDDAPMGESTCVQCGECSQLCPTGAIVDRHAKFQGRPWHLEMVDSVCPYCGVGCKLTLHVNRSTNKIVRVTGAEDGPANSGMLCVKGRYGMDFVSSHERLTEPLVKNEHGVFEKVSWATAFSLIADRFNGIKHEFGPDAIGGLASAKVTNEENYAFQKFMRKEVGTNNVDHCARL